MKRACKTAIFFLGASACLIILGKQFIDRVLLDPVAFHRAAVPATVELADAEEPTLVQGGDQCGIAIFRISSATSQRLSAEGVAALSRATVSRGGDRAYYSWIATPASIPINGQTCREVDAVTRESIKNSLSNPGSFVTTRKGPSFETLLIDPRKRWFVRMW